jgi:dipeptidyl aminopeptidase/acylaminoacyl peptidase
LQPQPIATLQAHTNLVRCIALSPDGKTLVSGSDDLTVRVWDLPAGKVRTTLRGHQGRVEFVALTSDAKTVVSADRDGVIKVWDADAGVQRFQLTEQGERLFAMMLCADGKTLVSARNDDWIFAKDVTTAARTAALKFEAGRCWNVAFSPRGDLFAWGDREQQKRLRLWELPSGNERQIPDGGRDVAPQLFSPDGKSLVVIVHSHDLIELLELATGNVRSRIPDVNEGELCSMALHPGGRILACAYCGGTGPLKFWDVATGKPAGEIPGRSLGLEAIAFSADGNTLAASEGPDTTIRVWNVHPFWNRNSAEHTALSKDRLESLWDGLADDNAAKAFQAMWRVTDASPEELAWFAQRLRPVAAADPQQTAPLVAALENDDFDVRERAAGDLEEIGDAAVPALRAALAAGPSPESRRRAGAILERLDSETDCSQQRLRQLRTVEALENAGTPQARQFLEKLAGGIAEARLTREAKASLARLSRYKK